MLNLRPIVGREAELKQLASALDDARDGRGGVWFVTGEPGIGKTRLVEALAERGAAAGCAVYWGRCWEAGGAPAYWPWIEVLRALLRGAPNAARQAIGARASVLAQLLPELSDAGPETSAARIGGERGRFELLDGLARCLCDAAREPPLLVVIEDLHVADDATVGVLELLILQARSSRLLVVCTLRDADARLARGGAALVRLSQGQRRVELTRLGKAAVAEYLTQTSGLEPGEPARDAVYRVTEGNPLFLVEVSRLLAERRGWHDAEDLGVAIPRSVRHAIRARFERLSPRTRSVLDVASVIGRQFRALQLAQLSEQTIADLAAPLTEALDEGVLSEIAPAEYRFSHVLLREVLHLDLPETRRSGLHWEAADVLRRQAGHEPPWSEIAHHLLEVGPHARQPAVDACSRAAAESESTLAFSDAVEWYKRALAALGQDPGADLPRRGPLLLSLASAEFHAGNDAAGRATCLKAIALARQLDDGELFARGALAYGTLLQFVVVDPTLIELLREALSALPAGPSKLRALVLARLAAAEQPAPDPEGPIAMGREAIAMARAESDPETLLRTLRDAVSAMMDLAAPAERLALNREYVRLAATLGQPRETLRGWMRQAFDLLELGDFAALDASIEMIEVSSKRLSHPSYTWRAQAFRAMRALLAGRFADAERHREEAERLGQLGRDPMAAMPAAFQRHMLLRCLGRDEEVLSAMPACSQAFGGSELGMLSVRVMTAEVLLRLGRRQQAASHLRADDLLTLVRYRDVSTFAAMSQVVLALELPAVAEAALAELDARPRSFASGGMSTMTAGEPVSHIRATLLRALGRHDAAHVCYTEALQQARQAGALPFAAWIAVEHASLIAQTRPSEARELAHVALAHAIEWQAPGLLARARALLPPEPAALSQGGATAPASAPPALSLHQEGESWLIGWGTLSVRLTDSKGLRWLAQLVREPGREFHVLDLCASEGTLDAGDAGELLDPRARQEYRERLQSLEAELEEARAHNDPARGARVEAELEFLRAELSRALGLGGRERRAGGAAERARINVQRRLRDTVRRITLQHAELGQRLERSLKTGLYCSYRP
jgi:tetratricopeptide (TPR) repeat protein